MKKDYLVRKKVKVVNEVIALEIDTCSISSLLDVSAMGGKSRPSRRGKRSKKKTTSCEQRAQSIAAATTRVSNTSEEARFVSRQPLRQVDFKIFWSMLIAKNFRAC